MVNSNIILEIIITIIIIIVIIITIIIMMIIITEMNQHKNKKIKKCTNSFISYSTLLLPFVLINFL